MSDPLVLAYLAGVIDSDGCISIKRSDYAMRVRGDASQCVYSERITVKQVEPQAVELLHETFGGHRYIERPNEKRRRPMFVWNIHSAAAGRALVRLYHYLRIKQPQAQNAIGLRDIMGTGRKWEVPPVIEGEPMVTATEFAALAGAKAVTILQAARLGSIPSKRVGRSRMVPLSFLTAYKARMASGGHPHRSSAVSEAMESLYQNAKRLNRVGAAAMEP